MMTIELEQARKARGEIEIYRRMCRYWYVQIAPLIFASFTILDDHSFRGGSWAVVLLLLASVGLLYLYQYRRLKRRYAGNLELLQSLAAREGKSVSQFDAFLHYPPLLDGWNHRLEKHAIFWRLDRFLSGNGRRND
jgi:hypothetical protein